MWIEVPFELCAGRKIKHRNHKIIRFHDIWLDGLDTTSERKKKVFFMEKFDDKKYIYIIMGNLNYLYVGSIFSTSFLLWVLSSSIQILISSLKVSEAGGLARLIELYSSVEKLENFFQIFQIL